MCRFIKPSCKSHTPSVVVQYIWWLVAGFPPRRPRFESRSGHVGFMVDKVGLWQFFSEHFGFPCQFSFHRLLHVHDLSSSGTCRTGQLVAGVPSGLSLTPLQKTKKRTTYSFWLSGKIHFPPNPDNREPTALQYLRSVTQKTTDYRELGLGKVKEKVTVNC
jgi:hypothetical protein